MKISIEYCMQWNYEPKALSLRDMIKSKYGIDAKLISSGGGVFEVVLNNSLIFSKKELGRFPNENEIENVLDDYEWIS